MSSQTKANFKSIKKQFSIPTRTKKNNSISNTE